MTAIIATPLKNKYRSSRHVDTCRQKSNSRLRGFLRRKLNSFAVRINKQIYATRGRHYCMTPSAVSMALHPFCSDIMYKIPLLVETHQQLLIRRLAVDVVIITCGLQNVLWNIRFSTQMLHCTLTDTDAHMHTQRSHNKIWQGLSCLP